MNSIQPTIIAITGMPGAGKSTFAKAASQQMDIRTWYVGQPLLDECARRGLPPAYANRMDMGHRLGLFDSADPLKFIAHSYSAMRAAHHHPQPVIFDSVRSLAELEFLKSKNESVILVALLQGQAERTRRLAKRDNLPLEFVQRRDQMESGVSTTNDRHFSVGQLLALADHYVLSPNSDNQDSPTLENGRLFPMEAHTGASLSRPLAALSNAFSHNTLEAANKTHPYRS
jgi:dephospho-CoA kinase